MSLENTGLPIPVHTQRDARGRLVALTCTSTLSHPGDHRARWLLAVDGSACAARAAAAIVRVAATEPGQVVELINVQPWLSKEAAETELLRQGWQASHQTRQQLDAAGLAWRLHVVMGEAAPTIAQLAEELGSLGVCMGTHGLTPAKAVLLGSVSSRVLQLAQVPVLIVH